MYRNGCLRLWAAAAMLLAAQPAWAGPAEDQYAVAANHYVHQRWEAAVGELEAFLEQFPEHPQADVCRFLLGESLVQLGRYAEARTWLAQFLERAPEHRYAAQAAFRAGECAYLTGDRKEAERRLEQFRDRFPDHELLAYVLPYLGELALAGRRWETARARYSEALRRFPEGPLARQCRLGLGRALEQLGETSEAERYYRFLAADPAQPLADHAQLRLGLMFHQQGRYEQAEAALGEFARVFAASPLRTDACYWRGMALTSLERWAEAAAVFQKGVDEAPEHRLAPALAYWAAESLRRAGREDEARAVYDRVVRQWPESSWAADALQTLAAAALEQGDYQRLAQLAELAQTPERRAAAPEAAAAVLVLHARGLIKQGRYREAVRLLERLTQPPPNNTRDAAPDVPAEQWYYLGLARLGAGDPAGAWEALERTGGDEAPAALRNPVRLAAGSALLQLQRYEAALAPLQAYLASQPEEGEESDRCRAQLVAALTELGRLDDALAAYEQLEQRRPSDELTLAAALRLAEAAAKAGDRQTAARLFRHVARDGNPAEYVQQGLAGLAWTQWALDDIAASAETFQQLLAKYPQSHLAPEAALMRGQALERAGRDDEALAAYYVLLEQYPRAAQRPLALLRAAQLHERLQQDREAVALLEQLAANYPDFPQMDAALYVWAWALTDLGRTEEADRLFQRLADQFPESSYWGDAVYRLAERAARNQEHERAIALAQQIIDAGATGRVARHALYLRGQSAAALGRWTEVAPPLERLLAEYPDCELALPARYWIAEACYRQGQDEEAERRFAQLAEATRGRSDAWLAMIPLRRAQILARRHRWPEALALAAAIGKEHPGFKQLYEADYLLGRCYAALARFDEARRAYQRVIQSPEGGGTETAAMAQWMIGETYFHQQQYAEAIRAYHRVESLYAYPRWQAAALLQAAKCHERLGQPREAAQLYEQLLSEYGDTEFAGEAARRLNLARRGASAPDVR